MLEEIEIGKQWLNKAENDLLNADNNLKSKTVPFDTVCFHCQQSAEKMLKAYLVTNKRPHPISHDLLLILEQILPLDPNAEKLRDSLVMLTPYAVEIRYPVNLQMPSREDAIEARNAAAKVRNWLKVACPSLW